jgi:hypothetical protein
MAVLHKFPAPERAAFRRRHMCGADFTAILPLSKSSMVSGKLSGQNSSLAVPRWAAVSRNRFGRGPVAELVGIRVGVVFGVINLESSGVEASDWRLRHEANYHEA